MNVNSNVMLAEKMDLLRVANKNDINEYCRVIDRYIKSQDRVNISLEEYNQLQREIGRLKHENEELRDICRQIELPIDELVIEPDSLQTEYMDVPYEPGRVDYHLQFRAIRKRK